MPATLLFAAGAVYRSTDAGITGTPVAGLDRIVSLAWSRAAPGIVYAAGGDGANATIARSTDAGVTWTTVYSTTNRQENADYVTALALDPRDAGHVAAAVSLSHSGLVVATTDGGSTWKTLPSPSDTTMEVPDAVAINPRRPSELWVGWSITGLGTVFGRLEHSTDGGATWVRATGGLPAPAEFFSLGYDTLSGRFYSEVTPASGPNRTYATRDGVHFEQFMPAATAIGGTIQVVPATGYVLAGDDNAAGDLRAWPLIAPGAWPVAPEFAAYYGAVDHARLLGRPIGPSDVCGGLLCQYFEKAALVEQPAPPDPLRRVAYGALVADLLARQALLPIAGRPSTVTYRTLHGLAGAAHRLPPPHGFHGGTMAVAGGTFVPDSPSLAPVAGHVVPAYFWDYLVHGVAAPGGWLRDTGLPLTEAIPATVTKGALGRRQIMLQAFANAILTYDPQNPPAYRVERANVGSDYAAVLPGQVR
jgi:hypothetical protein